MRKFGLIGKSLAHSYSAKYFNSKFKEENLDDCIYDLYELDNIKNITKLIADNTELKGLNITTPFKESVLAFLDFSDASVLETGACNCIKIIDGKLHGYNTDISGFLAAFLAVMYMDYHKILILGNGGSSKAVMAALDELSLDYTIVARNPKNKYELNWNTLNTEIIKKHSVIINTTSAGMWPKINEFPDIPYEAITRTHLAFDLIYNPEKTEFLKKAEMQGAEIENGLFMLEQQAEESWKIYGQQ